MIKTLQANPELTPEQVRQIQQVITNLTLSDMCPKEKTIRNLEAVALGELSAEELIRRTTEKYTKKR